MEEHKTYPHFIRNKYFTWYCNIIQKAINENRSYDSNLHENHHVLPLSMGGTEMVVLTFREHYLCHELLTRFTKNSDRRNMYFALHTFFHFNYHRPKIKRSILYEKHKREFLIACKERTPYYKRDILQVKHKDTKEIFEGTRQEIIHHCDLTHQEIYNLIRASKDKRHFHSKKWGLWNTELKLYTYDIPRNTVKQNKLYCTHCGKYSTPGNYSRWHGKKCKNIDPTGHTKRTRQISNLNRKS